LRDKTDIAPENPAVLLDDFVSGRRPEAAFEELVERYGGLVYSSALRRTNNSQLAEDVAQNVFAIIARKAGSLRRHPALMAWIFKTTRFEASKAMRAERRRQKKHDALARDAEVETQPDVDEAAWREAIPLLDASLDQLSEKDRQVVLQRFYEERKFSEIAQESGRSEAACKMQVKRALGKLSRMLSSRGVTLSAATIGAALAGELTHAAPAKALAAIAPKILAASPQIGAAALATHAVETMSTIKTVTVTGAAVVALASAPFLMQQSKADKLREEIAGLDLKREELESRAVSLRARSSARGAGADTGFQATSVTDLLRASGEPIDVDELLESMMNVAASQDLMGLIRVILPITALSPEDYKALIKEIETHESTGQMKGMALEMLGSFAPSEDHQESIERMLKLGLGTHAYANVLGSWGASDPDAALAWYHEKLGAGELAKGVNFEHAEGYLLAELIGGIGSSNPERGLALYQDHQDNPGKMMILSQLGRSLGLRYRENREGTHLAALLDMQIGRQGRIRVVSAAINAAVTRGDYEGGSEFASRFLTEPGELNEAHLNMLYANQRAAIGDRIDWLVAHTDSEEAPKVTGELVSRLANQDTESVAAWIEGQPAGEIRDHGMNAYISARAPHGDFLAVLEMIEEIQNPELRMDSLKTLGRWWVPREPEAARAALPAEIVDQF